MAVTTDPFTGYGGDLQYFIPLVLADYIQRAHFPKSVLSNFFLDLSYLATEGGYNIQIPAIYQNAFTVSTQSVEGAEINTQSPAGTDTQLQLNTHSYIAFIIGDKDLRQVASKYNLVQVYADEIANYLIRSLEDALAALFASLTTNIVGSSVSPTVMSDQMIRTAIQDLDTANFDITNGNAAFFFHPKVFWGQLGSITKYYSNNISQFNYLRSGNFGPADTSRGLKGVLYDIPVYTSSEMPDSAGTAISLLATRNSFAFAMQTMATMPNDSVSGGASASMDTVQGKIRVQMEYQLRNLGMLCVADMIYGVKIIRDAGAVLIYSTDAAQS